MHNYGLLDEDQLPKLRFRSMRSLSNEDWDGWDIGVNDWLEPDTVEIIGNSNPIIVYRLGMSFRDAEELSRDARNLSIRFYNGFITTQ